MAASLEGSGSLRSFSGDTEDAKEYRRLKKVQPKARGANTHSFDRHGIGVCGTQAVS